MMLGAVAGGAGSGGGSGYTGPLDIVPEAIVAYGQRALSAAKLGTALYTIREDSGDTTQSFSSDAVTGDAPVAAINTFLDGADGFVSLWNDQGPDGKNVINDTAENQPQWLDNQYNGHPALSFFDSLKSLNTPGNVTFPNGAYTVFIVQNTNHGGPSFAANWECGAGDCAYIILNSYLENPGPSQTSTIAYDATSDGQIAHEAGGEVEDLTPSSAKTLIDIAWTFGSASVKVDGVSQIIAINNDLGPVATIARRLSIGSDDAIAPSTYFFGSMPELLIYPSVMADEDRDAIRQNIATYYGITLS